MIYSNQGAKSGLESHKINTLLLLVKTLYFTQHMNKTEDLFSIGSRQSS